jgi:hypothetical protein
MSCYKYWGKIEEIANKLSSYGDLDKYGDSAWTMLTSMKSSTFSTKWKS